MCNFLFVWYYSRRLHSFSLHQQLGAAFNLVKEHAWLDAALSFLSMILSLLTRVSVYGMESWKWRTELGFYLRGRSRPFSLLSSVQYMLLLTISIGVSVGVPFSIHSTIFFSFSPAFCMRLDPEILRSSKSPQKPCYQNGTRTSSTIEMTALLLWSS